LESVAVVLGTVDVVMPALPVGREPVKVRKFG
jgi:hypothetical protein